MLSKILVPLDETAESAAALPVASALAGATGAALELLHVLPELTSTAELTSARGRLARVAHELAGQVAPIETEVRFGSVPDEILAATEQGGADVVALATHARSGLARAFLGSVAEQVLVKSKVPVLLVRPGGQRITRLRTLLVPLDGTAGAALALNSAIALARSTGARIVLVEAVAMIPEWLFAAEMGSAGTTMPDPSWDDDALLAARRYLDGLAARLHAQGLDVEGRAIVGDPATTIATTAHAVAADLIVMSTRALTGPVRTVLGSTADAVVRHARRPVLLVRRGGMPASTPTADVAVDQREPVVVPLD